MSKRPVSSKVLYPELSYRVMEIVFEVHNQLGPGLTESIYEKAVIYDLEKRGIPYEQQKTISVLCKGQPIGTYRLGILINFGSKRVESIRIVN